MGRHYMREVVTPKRATSPRAPGGAAVVLEKNTSACSRLDANARLLLLRVPVVCSRLSVKIVCTRASVRRRGAQSGLQGLPLFERDRGSCRSHDATVFGREVPLGTRAVQTTVPSGGRVAVCDYLDHAAYPSFCDFIWLSLFSKPTVCAVVYL